ncbi:MAG: hypothetical protein Q8K02_00375 [Flavobacterium sp.]|nr:hypothetical protein [Flavobacterium sp.]
MIAKFHKAISFKTKTTQETYHIFINRYLENFNGILSKDNLLEFLSKFSKNSILTVFYSLKFFYKSIGIPMEITRGDIAPKGVKKIKEMMTHEEVRDLIIESKKHLGTIELGYIALSTIYGLRRIELYDTTSEMIDIDRRIFTPFTHKSEGANERIHLIPEEIAPVLFEMKEGLVGIKKKPVITQMNFFFDYAAERAGVQLRPRLGFHSIRRALITELNETDCKPIYIANFMRWKERNPHIMQEYIQLNPKKVDETIFESHPYLRYWRD